MAPRPFQARRPSASCVSGWSICAYWRLVAVSIAAVWTIIQRSASLPEAFPSLVMSGPPCCEIFLFFSFPFKPRRLAFGLHWKAKPTQGLVATERNLRCTHHLHQMSV